MEETKRQEQVRLLRQLAFEIEFGNRELPDFLMGLLSAPVGPPRTQAELEALQRAQKAWAEEPEIFVTIDEARRILAARDG